MNYDRVIFGAGIFGLYAAKKCLEKGESVLVIEYDDVPFKRASFINQARVHNGYHYPRSISTAKKSVYYFDRFVDEFGFAILKDFKKIYAVSKNFSYTNAGQFAKFCSAAGISCEPIGDEKYFRPGMCDGVFNTLEYTFDAKIICEHMLNELKTFSSFSIKFNSKLNEIVKKDSTWLINTNNGIFETPYIVNSTYASLNQILTKAGLKPFKMKYELCEVILCTVSENIRNVGITVMDGPFFSLMPFGKTGYHSLTAVSNTPHLYSKSVLPEFACQRESFNCNPQQLFNCNDCGLKPSTNFIDMFKLVDLYLKSEIKVSYIKSLFSIKALLLASEVDDSRPTIINFANDEPKFLSIFSGKINTIYDLDEYL